MLIIREKTGNVHDSNTAARCRGILLPEKVFEVHDLALNFAVLRPHRFQRSLHSLQVVVRFGDPRGHVFNQHLRMADNLARAPLKVVLP